MSITADGPPEIVAAIMVSANYFNVLGVSAFRGRMFTADEDVGLGAHAVVVLSHGAWKSLFASDPNSKGDSPPSEFSLQISNQDCRDTHARVHAISIGRRSNDCARVR